MSTVQDSVSQAPAVTAPAKKSMTVGSTATLIVLALLLITPLFVKNFIIFQMTMVLIYAIAILALNCSPAAAASSRSARARSCRRRLHRRHPDGASRRQLCADDSRGRHRLLIFGFLFGFPALRLSGVYLALATFALAVAMPQS
jgi:branched-chain amino acid transport system permease protein